MKKIITVLLVSLMVFAVAGCGKTQKEEEPAKEWDKTGYFEDENGCFLYVDKFEDQTEDGWYVMFLPEEEMYGGYVPQKGNDLKGEVYTDLETKAGATAITISEDGENLVLTVDGGKTYKFAPSDIAERTFTITINTEGYGYFNCLTDSDNFETDEDFSTSSMILNLQEPATYTLTAQAGEGYVFTEWKKNGEDYSAELEITEEFTEDAEYIAVFEFVE
ncbi:MAG: hypothetical protein IJJ00_02805 [Erysipelotrichaceae bacterium]|nr:hypothetical protein [Erysipelotrichaceae bacterium]